MTATRGLVPNNSSSPGASSSNSSNASPPPPPHQHHHHYHHYLTHCDHYLTSLIYNTFHRHNLIIIPFKMICFLNKGVLSLLLWPLVYLMLRLCQFVVMVCCGISASAAAEESLQNHNQYYHFPWNMIFTYLHRIYFLIILDGMFVSGVKHLLRRDRPDETVYLLLGSGSRRRQMKKKDPDGNGPQQSSSSPQQDTTIIEETITEASDADSTSEITTTNSDKMSQRLKQRRQNYRANSREEEKQALLGEGNLESSTKHSQPTNSSTTNITSYQLQQQGEHSTPNPAATSTPPITTSQPLSLYQTLKKWKRSRDEFSFPSGHSSKSALYVGICLYIIIQHAHDTDTPIFSQWYHYVTFFLLLLNAFLTGFGRVVLGRHFIVDVLCGWSIGFCEGALVPFLCEFVWR